MRVPTANFTTSLSRSRAAKRTAGVGAHVFGGEAVFQQAQYFAKGKGSLGRLRKCYPIAGGVGSD